MSEKAPTTRVCKKCAKEKPLGEFMKMRSCRWGRGHQCKSCSAAGTRAWRASHPEMAKQRYLEWAEGSRQWRKDNPDAHRESSRRWRAENGLAIAGATIRKSAVKRGARLVEEVIPLVVLERDDGICGVCGEDVNPSDFHVDHIVSCEDGGDHSYENVQVAHASCNTRKSNATRGRNAKGQFTDERAAA